MPISALTTSDFTPKTADQAASAFGKKIALTSEQFDRLSAANKARAFRIATVNNARLVQQARDMLERAIRDGRPYAEFRRELLALFDEANIPRPALSRLRLAFHQNTMQAYSDARRKTLDRPDVAKLFAYRRYMTVGNGTPGVRRVRADHAILHGKVFAANDVFWDRFTPPWDYGCRCTTLALTAGQVAKRGVTVWTYKGGGVRPLPASQQPSGRKRDKPFALQPKDGFGGKQKIDFDLSGLDADIRKAIEENVK